MTQIKLFIRRLQSMISGFFWQNISYIFKIKKFLGLIRTYFKNFGFFSFQEKTHVRRTKIPKRKWHRNFLSVSRKLGYYISKLFFLDWYFGCYYFNFKEFAKRFFIHLVKNCNQSYERMDNLIECPYNRAHQIRPERMQYHLIKCRKQVTSAPTQYFPVCFSLLK